MGSAHGYDVVVAERARCVSRERRPVLAQSSRPRRLAVPAHSGPRRLSAMWMTRARLPLTESLRDLSEGAPERRRCRESPAPRRLLRSKRLDLAMRDRAACPLKLTMHPSRTAFLMTGRRAATTFARRPGFITRSVHRCMSGALALRLRCCFTARSLRYSAANCIMLAPGTRLRGIRLFVIFMTKCRASCHRDSF